MTESTGLTLGAVAFIVMKAFLFFVSGGDYFGCGFLLSFLFGFLFYFIGFEVDRKLRIIAVDFSLL